MYVVPRGRRIFLSAHPSSRSTLDPTTTPFDAASDDAFRRRLDIIRDDVSLRFEDGSECVVADADPDRLIPSENSSLFPDEEQCPYFPGLVCHASASVLRSARWTRGKYKGGRTAGVVSEARSISYWFPYDRVRVVNVVS